MNGAYNGTLNYQSATISPVVRFAFSSPVQASVIYINANFSYLDGSSSSVPFTLTLQNNDSVVIIQPASPLKGFSKYTLSVLPGLLSSNNGTLVNPASISINTLIDSTDKFPQISDSALLTLIETNIQLFLGFWPSCLWPGEGKSFVGRYCNYWRQWLRHHVHAGWGAKKFYHKSSGIITH